MRDKIIKVLDNIRPALQADGGDVEFVSFDEKSGQVKVRLQGACKKCPMSTVTLQENIEKVLKKNVPEVRSIIRVD